MKREYLCNRFTDFNQKPNNYNEKWEEMKAQEHASKGTFLRDAAQEKEW